MDKRTVDFSRVRQVDAVLHFKECRRLLERRPRSSVADTFRKIADRLRHEAPTDGAADAAGSREDPVTLPERGPVEWNRKRSLTRAFRIGKLALAALVCCFGCSEKAVPRFHATIKLATTTSTESSGLLEALLPAFTEKHGIMVHPIAVGTGKAIRLAENGDVDVILVHAPPAERKFVEEGFGVDRRDVMHNDFVILGPAPDPAGVRGTKDAAAALTKIARARSPFVSRGDDSGTNSKEKALWGDAGVEPSGAWYMPAGQGMAAVLLMAHEKRAYTLADRGTYIALRDKVQLEVLVEGDRRLLNPYGVIAVNPARHPHVRYAEAMTFIAWLTSPEGQEIIAGHTRDGEQLFYPDAVKQAGP